MKNIRITTYHGTNSLTANQRTELINLINEFIELESVHAEIIMRKERKGGGISFINIYKIGSKSLNARICYARVHGESQAKSIEFYNRKKLTNKIEL